MKLRHYILTLVMLFVLSSAVAQTSKIEQQKRVIADLERSIAKEEKQLSELKKNKASTEAQVSSLTKQIEKRRQTASQ